MARVFLHWDAGGQLECDFMRDVNRAELRLDFVSRQPLTGDYLHFPVPSDLPQWHEKQGAYCRQCRQRQIEAKDPAP